jgi:hypothetical protein
MSEPSAGKWAASMAAGGFAGGLIAGEMHAGFLLFAGLSLLGSVVAVSLISPNWKSDLENNIGTILGLSTFIPLPCGFIGMILSK